MKYRIRDCQFECRYFGGDEGILFKNKKEILEYQKNHQKNHKKELKKYRKRYYRNNRINLLKKG